jgi:peptidoglycan hydrolase-like protein with peptidoglycan-binding domain
MQRFGKALGSDEPKTMRAEAARLRKDGYPDLADQLDTAALKREAELAAAKPKPTANVPTNTAPRVLTQGMKGEDVKAWQQQLIRDGYLVVKADGNFGPVTKSSTQIWQAERGLSPDGIVGPATRAAIGSAPIASVPGAPAPKPATAAAPKPAPKPTAPKPAPAPAPAAPKPAPAPAPAMVSTAPRLLKVGMQGEDVKAWQQQLVRDGHGITADGIYGAKTKDATVAWQLARGLSADGIVGPNTLAAVGQKAKPSTAPTSAPPLTVNPSTWRTIQIGMSGPDVKEWQLILQRDGYQVATDGIFGPGTKSATVAWQVTHGLSPDGVVGKGTRAAIETGGYQVVAGEAALAVPRRELGAVHEHATAADLAEALAAHIRQTAEGHEDRQLIERFQRAVGLNDTGAYGAATARAIADFGVVPPKPRVWPVKKNLRAKTQYRFALRSRAKTDPRRADEWLSASNV